MREAIAGTYVGHRVKRVEDERLLTGRGRFIADVEPDGVLHAAFLRSPYPHATIDDINANAARSAEGVVAVYTGDDIQRLTNPFLPLANLPGQFTPLFWGLAVERVRFVGDPVAVVIATSRYVAEDALELIEVDYTELPAVASMDEALRTSSEPVWPKARGNVLYEADHEYGDVDTVFARADRVFTETFDCHRVSNQPMETRGAVAEVDPDTGEITYHAATQASHMLRWALAMATSKRSTVESIRALFSNRERLKAFGAGAKAALADKVDDLKKADNRGTIDQLKKDPSTVAHLGRTVLNTLSELTFPRVVAQDIGGGFGAKGPVNREDAVVLAVAKDLNQSVRWIEDRVENLLDGGQAREDRITLSLATTNDGVILGMKADLVMDQGAYPGVPFNCGLFAGIIRVMMPGTYRMRGYRITTTVTASNKARYVPYRGPWANETWARERMLDVVAAKLGLSPTEFRLRNMHGPEHLPAKMITGPSLDTTMTAKATLETALELAEIDDFESRQAEARQQGRWLGVGFATYHEAAPGPPDFADSISPGTGAILDETVNVELRSDGSVVVKTQQMPHGQSHETTYAQVAAEQLGLPLDQVSLIFGDTANTPFGIMGTGGSRGGPIGGGAVQFSSRELRKKVLDEAAGLLEADVDDLEIIDGNIHVVGVPAKGTTYAEVAAAVLDREGRSDGTALSADYTYSGPKRGGWAAATHVCFVEIDANTGQVTIPRYLVVEDCGEMINPAIVEGQVRGGVAQGIGAVLYERSAYDAQGNFQASTYLDYLIPTAMEIPEIEIHHLQTPSDIEANYRGVGEGGAIGAPPAVTNAIENALAHLDVKVREQYLPPTRILELAGVI